MGKRIAIIINHSERELESREAVAAHLKALDPSCRVEIIEFRAKDWKEQILELAPSVIMTFPFTALGIASPFYVFKDLFNCRIVTLRTEGIVKVDSADLYDWHIGQDHYGPTLCDYDIFWGPTPAHELGTRLVAVGKLFSVDRAIYTGYIPFEFYKSRNRGSDGNEIPERIRKAFETFPHSRTVLIATDFRIAEYTPEDILNAADWFDATAADAEENFAESLRAVENGKICRDEWLTTIADTAKANPTALFIVKSHPIENIILRRRSYNPYEAIHDLPNVIHVQEKLHIGHLLKRAAAFYHYGSTANLEAYLCKVPSYYISMGAQRRSKFFDFGEYSASQGSLEICDFPRHVAEHLQSTWRFNRLVANEEYLMDYFAVDIEHFDEYEPSRQTAALLLRICDEPALSLDEKDPEYKCAWSSHAPGIITFLIEKVNQAINLKEAELGMVLLEEAANISRRWKIPVEKLHYILGTSLLNSGQIDKACEALETELKFFPNDQACRDLLQVIHNTPRNSNNRPPLKEPTLC